MFLLYSHTHTHTRKYNTERGNVSDIDSKRENKAAISISK